MLVEAIKLVAEETQSERQPYRHRPSSVCRCIRSLVYHATGVETKPLPGRALLIFDDSSWQEELTADWIRKTAYGLNSQQMPVDILNVNGYTVRGHIDGIVQDPLGKDRLWEHKAINHFAFQRIVDDPSTAHEYYIQCALYLYGLQKLQPDITEALLFIKNKNTAQSCEFFVVLDGADINIFRVEGTQRGEFVHKICRFIDFTITVFDTVDKHIQTKTLPDRPYERNDWHCSYCGWQEQCWEGYEEEVRAMAAGVDLSLYIDSAVFDDYLGLQSVKSECEKKLKVLKKEIVEVMNTNKLQSGMSGDVLVSRNFRQAKGYAVEPRTDEILSVKQLDRERV